MLGKLTEPVNHADWTKQLSTVQYALNNTIHKSIGTTPSRLLFGVDQRGPTVDILAEHLSEADVDGLERDLEVFRARASECIERSQTYSQKWFDEHCKPAKEYKEGDYVVVRHVDTSVGSNKKLLPRFRGPYVVKKKLDHDRYVVQDVDNCQITQIPYNGIIEARHMRLWKLPLNSPEIFPLVEPPSEA